MTISEIKSVLVNRMSQVALEKWNGSRELANEIVIIAQREGVDRALEEIEAYALPEVEQAE